MGTRLHCHLHFFVLAVQEEQEMMEDSCSTHSPPIPPHPPHPTTPPLPLPPPHASLPLLSDPSHNPEGEGWSFGNFPVWAQHGFLLAEGVTNMFNKILQVYCTVLYYTVIL